jgi:hypothetical protein
MSNKRTTVAVATHGDKGAAEQDFDAVWGIRHEGQIDHLAIAMVEKTDDAI